VDGLWFPTQLLPTLVIDQQLLYNFCKPALHLFYPIVPHVYINYINSVGLGHYLQLGHLRSLIFCICQNIGFDRSRHDLSSVS